VCYPKSKAESMSCFIQYSEDCEFPIQNLPYGVFKPNANETARCGVAIGDQVLDLSVLAANGCFDNDSALEGGACFSDSTLNKFMELGREAWTQARAKITALLSGEVKTLSEDTELQGLSLHPQSQVIMQMPASIGDYTDFYASRNHATNVGTMFRGAENALNPNWTHLPVGYHGRASSVVLSGTDIILPSGQTITDKKATKSTIPNLTNCRLMDFELEMGCFIGGQENKLGHPVSIEDAKDRLFGVVLLNDWSARDIQKWEYVPLGPFCGKNFASSISPWVVTFDALAPFATPIVQDPVPLPYLREDQKSDSVTGYDIKLQVGLKTDGDENWHTISNSNLKGLYWSFRQMLAHHSSTGCNMRPGDLLGSGTISGTTNESYGSMLEICWVGTKPLTLPNGQVRKFLKPGDELVLTGHCQGEGYRVGFGSCTGKILPALPL